MRFVTSLILMCLVGLLFFSPLGYCSPTYEHLIPVVREYFEITLDDAKDKELLIAFHQPAQTSVDVDTIEGELPLGFLIESLVYSIDRGREVWYLDNRNPNFDPNNYRNAMKIVDVFSIAKLAATIVGKSPLPPGLSDVISMGFKTTILAFELTSFINDINYYNIWDYFKMDKRSHREKTIEIIMEEIREEPTFYLARTNIYINKAFPSAGFNVERVVRNITGGNTTEHYEALLHMWDYDYYALKVYQETLCFKEQKKCDEEVNRIPEIRKWILEHLSLPERPDFSQSTVAIVMDVSGSMSSDGKLDQAKEAANILIDSQPSDSFISLTSFSSGAKSEVELIKISEGKDFLKRSVNSLSVGGGTNIGAGLAVGINQLFSGPILPKNPTIVLLSDGMNNRGDLWGAVDKCIERGVVVNTVAFGRDADWETLALISQRTGGQVFYGEVINLGYVYHRIGTQIQNNSTLFATNDILRTGEKLSYSFDVDPDVESLTFFTNWPGSRVLMELTDPSGQKMVPNPSWDNYIEEPTYIMFDLDSQPGEWQVDIEGRDFPAQGGQVNVAISGKSPLYANTLSFFSAYPPGSTVLIGVEIAEIEGLERLPISNVNVNAEIRKPSPAIAKKTSSGIEISLRGVLGALIGDGDVTVSLRQDFHLGEGVFSASFSETDNEGTYVVTIFIEGEMDCGQKINRKIVDSFQVVEMRDDLLTAKELFEEIFWGVLGN